jgi:hypothetical protein
MNFREVVALTLTSKRIANANGRLFELDADKLIAMGFTPDGILRIAETVMRIEMMIATELAALDQIPESTVKQEPSTWQ